MNNTVIVDYACSPFHPGKRGGLIVIDTLANVPSGGGNDLIEEISGNAIFEPERINIGNPVQNQGAQDRMRYMPETAKPLRNQVNR